MQTWYTWGVDALGWLPGSVACRPALFRPYPAFFAMARRLQREKRNPWTVRIVPRLRVFGEECWGRCDWPKHEIVLTRAANRHGVDRQVFLHEMVHKICPWMDEDAVDDMASQLDDALDVMGM